MICHETKMKIDRYRRTRIKITRDILRETKMKILISDYLSPAPAAPTSLSIVTTTATTVEIDWDAPANLTPDSYTIYVENVATGNIMQTITGLSSTDHVVTGLLELTEYEFWVTAVADGVESGESNHVTTTTLSGGETRNISSLSFDGSSGNRVEIGNIFTGLTDHTVTAVFKINNLPSNLYAIAGQGYLQGDDNGFGIFVTSSGEIRYQARNGSTNVQAESGVTVETGQWYVVAGVRRGDDSEIWVNTVQEDVATGALGNNFDSDDEFAIGSVLRSSWDFSVDGKIDEVQLWNKALTRAEIVENTNKILKGDESGLIGYWNSEDRNSSQLTDLTSNNNHGTINGATYAYDAFDFDYGLEFNDANQDEVRVTGYKGILGQSAFTLDVEFSSTHNNNGDKHRMIGWGDDNINGGKAHLRLNDDGGSGTVNAIRFEWQGGYWIGSKVLNDGEKHKVRVIKPQGDDGSGIVILIDGEVESPSSVNAGQVIDLQSKNDLVLGYANQDSATSDEHWSGILDKFALWSIEKTVLESQRELNKELEGDEPGLELLYKFDDLTDLTKAVDSSDNDRHGAISGAKYTTDVKSYFQGLSYDGSGDYVNIPSHVVGGLTEITVSARIRPFDLSNDRLGIVSYWDDDESDKSILFRIESDGTLQFFIRSDAGTTHNVQSSSGLISAGEQCRVSANYDGTDLKLFKNESLINTVTDSGLTINTPSNELHIGGRPNVNTSENWLDGIIEEARIWNIATVDDLTKPLKGDENGLIGLWRMNEGVGSKVYDHVGTNHGAINGAIFTEKVGVKV